MALRGVPMNSLSSFALRTAPQQSFLFRPCRTAAHHPALPNHRPGAQHARVIDVHDLTKLYGDFPAVRGLSFRVAPGEVLGLVGPNGAGKTTTLRSLSGIIVPTGGSIRIAGFDLAERPIDAKRALA